MDPQPLDDEPTTILDLLRHTRREEVLFPFSRDLVRVSVAHRYLEVGAQLIQGHPVIEAGLDGATKALMDGHVLILTTKASPCGHIMQINSHLIDKHGNLLTTHESDD